MNRPIGTGIIVFGIILVAAGAIMRYAVTASATGFSITEVGLILLVIGVVTILLGSRAFQSLTVTDIAVNRLCAAYRQSDLS